MEEQIKCDNCGGNNSLNSNFCEFCGFKLENKKENENNTVNNENQCLNCGTTNISNSKFCKNCGNKLNSSLSDDNNTSFNISQLVPCPYCNSKIPVNSLKCRNCGEWIDKSKAPSEYNIPIVLGYIFTFLGGLIGILIGIYLFTRDNENAKKHGKYMLTISLIFVLIFGFIFLSYFAFWTLSSSLSSGYY